MTTTNPPAGRAGSYRVGGTSSVDHPRENVAGAALVLPVDAGAELDAI